MVDFFDRFFNVFSLFRGVFDINNLIGGIFGGTLLLLFLFIFFISLVRGLR